jgi:hypothetical protein
MARFQKARSVLRKFLRVPEHLSLKQWYGSRVAYRSSEADLSLTAAVARFADQRALYLYMHHWLVRSGPDWLRAHRHYFSQQHRGFGDDAFHSMWFKLLAEYRPRRCLEIGVYRGQVISLWLLLAEKIGFPVEVHGISLFSPAGLPKYVVESDYQADTLSNCDHFSSKRPHLLRAYSTDPEALALINTGGWDLIYIDGCHDYEVVLADYQNCVPNLSPRGLLVFDDSTLYANRRLPSFVFAGLPGPSRVVRDMVMNEMHLVASVGHNNVFCAID